jgi:hypothetical protein
LSTHFVITREIVVAEGVFAPGHVGELTQQVPFEMVDAVLAGTGRVQSRVRDLPSRVVVYLLLAASLFPEVGYTGVWRKLTAGLTGLTTTATPTAGALAQARRRVGTAPLRALFELLRGPGADTHSPGVRWHGLLVVAIDGTILSCPDSPANLTEFRKQGGNHGGSGYPLIRLLALVACGTRTVIDAVFGPTASGETTYAHQLTRSMHQQMIVLADRNFAAQNLIAAIAGTGANVVVRLKNGRHMPVLHRYPDGSYLSRLGTTDVRVIDCAITATTNTGTHTSIYRLATTLTSHFLYPATELTALYHQRWEVETAYLEIKSTMTGGRVLRARTPEGVIQEIYALLVTYQALRTAMSDATATQPRTDPDRASFTVALQAARDQVIQAGNIIPDTVIDLVGTIGRHVLEHLMPRRRARTNPRVVKRAISKYVAKGTHVRAPSSTVTISVVILNPSDA